MRCLNAALGLAFILMTTGCQTGNNLREWKESLLSSDGPVQSRDALREADMAVAVARMQESHGKIDQAIDAYKEAVELHPERSDALWRLAVLTDRKGSGEPSAPFYESAIALEPKNVDLLTDYGYSLYLHENYPRAEEVLGQALAIDPRHQRAHNNLGFTLACQDRLESAMRQFQLAGCSEAETLSNVGLALAMSGRLEEARDIYELALQKEPTLETAQLGQSDLNAAIAQVQTRELVQGIEQASSNTVQQTAAAADTAAAIAPETLQTAATWESTPQDTP